MVIPPWLNISPDLFLQALASGTSAGQRARSLTDSETNSAFSRNRAGYGGGSPTLKVGGLFDGLGSRTDMNRPEEDYKSKRDYAQQLYGAMVGRLGEDEAIAQSGLGALLTLEEISARASLARAKATTAPVNPWETFNLGNGELGRVNKSTGDYQPLKEPREPTVRPEGNPWETFRQQGDFPKGDTFMQVNKITGETRPVTPQQPRTVGSADLVFPDNELPWSSPNSRSSTNGVLKIGRFNVIPQ